MTDDTATGQRLNTLLAWKSMKAYCNCPSQNGYKRGVTYCAAWENFETFIANMGPKPSNRHCLRRTDVRKPYGPKNCRWDEFSNMAKGRADAIRVTLGDQTHTLTDWSVITGIPYVRLYQRAVAGWPSTLVLSPDRWVRDA